jgi:hypothetical protein
MFLMRPSKVYLVIRFFARGASKTAFEAQAYLRTKGHYFAADDYTDGNV